MSQETTALKTLNINYQSNGYYADCNTSSSNPSNRGIITAQPYSVSQIKLINGNAGIADVRWWAIGKQQWGIWNDNRSAGQIQCTFPVSKAKETLAISATYFDNTGVSNGAILIKETTLSTCKIKLWSYTKISFWVIGYQSYNSISYCSPKSIYVSRT